MIPNEDTPILAITWVFLIIFSFVILFINKDALFKRELMKLYTIVFGSVLFWSIYLLGFRNQFLIFALPGVILMSFLIYRSVRFCDSCGKTISNKIKVEVCPKCGLKFP